MGDNNKNYLDGKMSPEELEQRTTQLLRAKFDKERSTRWQKLLQTQYGMERQAPTSPRASRRWLYIAVTIAALFLLLLWWAQSSPPTPSPPASAAQLALHYLDSEPYAHDRIRKGTPADEALRQQAQDAYSEQDYASSRRYYQQLIEQPQADLSDSFYLALSHCYLSDYDQAIALLHPLGANASPQNPYYDAALWYLALSHLLRGEEAQAKAYLEDFLLVKNWENQKVKARELLRTLK
ncbi:MAG: tetratricopeptide repeat protein [Bacteroidota bacterium]